MNSLDFSGLTSDQARDVRQAIVRGENFHGYIPTASLDFIVRNYRNLAAKGALERPWLDAYVHASDFSAYGMGVLKAVFDACDRQVLRTLKPLADSVKGERLTLFRGCAGPMHSLGMSWTSSLDKAIWYAARHAAYSNLSDLAVYATTVATGDVYCQLDHYDEDFIVCARAAWRIDVPIAEFRLDRPR